MNDAAVALRRHHERLFAPPHSDWSTCLSPWRTFDGPSIPIRSAKRTAHDLGAVLAHAVPASTVDRDTLGAIARLTLGVTAERERNGHRWCLRANPSSGGLHPTELYVVIGNDVLHYDARHHRFTLVRRLAAPSGTPWIALTQIVERQCWKYGDRGVRYAELDLGHAVGALALAASSRGLRLHPVASPVAHRDLFALDDAQDAYEAMGALFAFTPNATPPIAMTGTTAVRHPINPTAFTWRTGVEMAKRIEAATDWTAARTQDADELPIASAFERLALNRRSAHGLNRKTPLSFTTLERIMQATHPRHAPALFERFGDGCVTPVLYVHDVAGLEPGAYLYLRRPAALLEIQTALATAFDFERIGDSDFYRFDQDDLRPHARLVHVDQAVASDGHFAVTMLAPLASRLVAEGAGAYRHVHLEAGAVGHAIYLASQAFGFGATGIGAFDDEAIREMFGVRGDRLSPIYGFAVGTNIETSGLEDTVHDG